MADDDLVRVGSTADVGQEDRLIVEVGGLEVAVFEVDGEYRAYLNYCPHQGGPICEGKVSGTLNERDGELVYERDAQILSCPWHAWEFDLQDGRALTNPRYRLPPYEVETREGDLYLRM